MSTPESPDSPESHEAHDSPESHEAHDSPEAHEAHDPGPSPAAAGAGPRGHALRTSKGMAATAAVVGVVALVVTMAWPGRPAPEAEEEGPGEVHMGAQMDLVEAWAPRFNDAQAFAAPMQTSTFARLPSIRAICPGMPMHIAAPPASSATAPCRRLWWR